MPNNAQYDVISYQIVTDALMALLNSYSGLGTDSVTFSVINEDNGLAMFPISGAIIESDRRDILGGRTQICLYPFYIVYRAGGLSSTNKNDVKEFLDAMGEWLESLEEFPVLTGNRRFLEIKRQTPAFLQNIDDNNVEDWAISITARYENNL